MVPQVYKVFLCCRLYRVLRSKYGYDTGWFWKIYDTQCQEIDWNIYLSLFLPCSKSVLEMTSSGYRHSPHVTKEHCMLLPTSLSHGLKYFRLFSNNSAGSCSTAHLMIFPMGLKSRCLISDLCIITTNQDCNPTVADSFATKCWAKQLFLAMYLPFSERKTSIDKISSCDQRATEKWCEDDAFILSDLFWIYLPPRKSLYNQDEGLLQRFCQVQDILISLCWFLPLATGSQGWVSVKWRVAGSQIQ